MSKPAFVTRLLAVVVGAMLLCLGAPPAGLRGMFGRSRSE